MSPPVGPTGLPAKCDGSEPATWQVTGSVSGFSTQIDFNDGPHLATEQLAATASVGHFGSPSFGWSLSAGGIVAGRIDHRAVDGGGTFAGTLSWLPVFEQPARPFVAFTGTLSGSLVRAEADDARTHSWLADDLRLGVTVGKTFAERWVPYASARGFGGSVSWTAGGTGVTGGDHYHYALGAGLTVRLPDNYDATVEAMPLGERSTAIGVTKHI